VLDVELGATPHDPTPDTFAGREVRG
jgi:hypothetical protein